MAYFSNTGAKIYSGAAGVPGLLRAYKDGSLGVMATMIRGSGQKWHSNVRYEEDPEEVFIKPPPQPPLRRGLFSIYSMYSRRPKRPLQPVRGTLMAYQDGVLGGYGQGPLQAFQDGSLGASGAGPLQSYQDGSLGYPLFLDTPAGRQVLEEPVTITHGAGEYYSATGEYFSGTAGVGGCGSCGVGAAASQPVLNLSDPATLFEVKSMIAYSPLMANNANLPETQTDLKSTKWTAYTTALVEQLLNLSAMQAVAAYDAAPAGQKPKGADGAELTKEQYLALLGAEIEKSFPPPERYPSYDGIMFLRTLLASAPVSLPKVDAFITAAGTTGGLVLPPNQAKQANIVGLGIGAAALALGAVLLFSKKKRS